MNSTRNFTYDVFVNDPPPQDNGLLPNGEAKGGSPVASTLIYGSRDAVLTDPGFTADQAGALGDWLAGKDRNLTDIFITHGHGDHWFAAGLLAQRFGARVVATAGTIAQMHLNVAVRPLLWDKVYPGIPPSPVTAVTVPGNRFTLEGHDLVIVEVGHADTDDNSVLHVPDLGLVVAGDVIYNGAHMYLGEGVVVGGFGPWRAAINKVEALGPRHIVAGHRTGSSTTTPGGRSPRPGSISTTPTNSCGARRPPWASSAPRSSGTPTTWRGRCCGLVPAHSTACANTPQKTQSTLPSSS